MKIKSICLSALLILGTVLTFAQAPKIGHINTAKLLQLMPEVEGAQADLKKYQTEIEGQLDVLVTEYRKKIEEYQDLPATTSTTIKKDMETLIVQLEERIRKFQETAQEELDTKEKDLLQPILDKVQKAIEDVAKENKYDYILDTSGGTVLYSKESDDITPLVKKKLGLP